MTRDIEVPDAIFDPVCEQMGATTTLELVATIAAYNMVSWFLVAAHRALSRRLTWSNPPAGIRLEVP
jgi:hypothetical protein